MQNTSSQHTRREQKKFALLSFQFVMYYLSVFKWICGFCWLYLVSSIDCLHFELLGCRLMEAATQLISVF